MQKKWTQESLKKWFLLPVFSNKTLSFNPSRNSGMPVRYTFILTDPTISLRSTFPFALTNKLTDSITSKKTSFFRYFKPSVRHDTAFVTAGGGRGAASNLWLCCVINL